MRQFYLFALIAVVFVAFTHPYIMGMYYKFRIQGVWSASFPYSDEMFNSEQVTGVGLHFKPGGEFKYKLRKDLHYDRVVIEGAMRSHNKGKTSNERVFSGEYYIVNNQLYVTFKDSETMKTDYDLFMIDEVIAQENNGKYTIKAHVKLGLDGEHLLIKAGNAGQEVYFNKGDQEYVNDFMLFRHQYESENSVETPVQKTTSSGIGDPYDKENVRQVVEEMLDSPYGQMIDTENIDTEQLLNATLGIIEDYRQTLPESERPEMRPVNQERLINTFEEVFQEYKEPSSSKRSIDQRTKEPAPQYVPYEPDK